VSRYAVYTRNVGRLEAVVEAKTPGDAIWVHLADLGYGDDAEDQAVGLVAVEVTDAAEALDEDLVRAAILRPL